MRSEECAHAFPHPLTRARRQLEASFRYGRESGSRSFGRLVLLLAIAVSLYAHSGAQAQHGSNGLFQGTMRADSSMSSTGVSIAAPASSTYDPGFGEHIGVLGLQLGAADQSAPQWILSFYQGFLNPGGSPYTLGVRGLDAPGIPTTWPTYSQAINDSTAITTVTTPSIGLPFHFGRFTNIDVTDFMHSLPVDSGGAINPGFVFHTLNANGNTLVQLTGEILWRDGSVDAPFLPTGPIGDIFRFPRLPSGRYYDPVLAPGFLYQMTDGALFTRAFDFPAGFDNPFTVSVGDVVIGQFATGESVDFTGFPGGGVSSFTVSGISPAVDTTNQLAFPLGLDFNQPAASFDMIPVPEPATSALAGCGILALAAIAWWRRGCAC